MKLNISYKSLEVKIKIGLRASRKNGQELKGLPEDISWTTVDQSDFVPLYFLQRAVASIEIISSGVLLVLQDFALRCYE
ncbi:hypothetical protein M8J75_008744 [Diaphorina citri]|nr:hypothetical protein M8J75_008744 [Diaphorina citri]